MQANTKKEYEFMCEVRILLYHNKPFIFRFYVFLFTLFIFLSFMIEITGHKRYNILGDKK